MFLEPSLLARRPRNRRDIDVLQGRPRELARPLGDVLDLPATIASRGFIEAAQVERPLFSQIEEPSALVVTTHCSSFPSIC